MKGDGPLGLVDGSVRALLAIGALGIGGAAVLLELPVPEWLIGLMGMAIGGYFSMRKPPGN